MASVHDDDDDGDAVVVVAAAAAAADDDDGDGDAEQVAGRGTRPRCQRNHSDDISKMSTQKQLHSTHWLAASL